MATLGSVMNSALRSMAANQLALSVASNNIANAQTPEFTRQRLVTAPSGSDGGTLGIGAGVDVVAVEALRDTLVETRLRQETSARAGEDALAKSLSTAELLFNDTNDTGFMTVLTNFFNSFQTLSLDPASTNFREELKIRARALVDFLHARERDLSNIKNVADQAISADVFRINTLAAQIAAISSEIQLQEVVHPANDLRDRRAALVMQLSEIVEVRELDSTGNYQLSTKNNRLLVLNGSAQTISPQDVTSDIGNGSLKAELDTRDQYIPKYLGALDQITYELAQQVNVIHSAAYGLDGNTGVNFFMPLSEASGASRLIEVSAEVSADSRSIAASELSTSNDNRAAIRLGNLRHQPVFTGGSITDQYRTIVFEVGMDVAAAETRFSEHDALASQLQNRKQSVSGVSIDEETVQILQFQRAYEASARLIRTVDELLQVALGLGAVS